MIISLKSAQVKRAERREKFKAAIEWHTFFCIWPRRVDHHTLVCMHHIQRRVHPERAYLVHEHGYSAHQAGYEYRTYPQALSAGGNG